MMKFYVKRGWMIFIGSSGSIIILGLIFLLLDKRFFIPAIINDTNEHVTVDGWPVMIMGIVMLLFGLLLKWAANNEKDGNEGPGNPPRTELVDKKFSSVPKS